jgi:hypothetical protein
LLDFEDGGIRYTAGAGRFGDGGLAEIFLSAAKHIARIEIDKSGKIVIITTHPSDQPGKTAEANEWDRVR